MLPPILEIYVVWHPDDREGQRISRWLLEHFHGTPYQGLIGGAVEVYSRSAPWGPGSDAPRPLPFQRPLPYQLAQARVTAIVPVLGAGLARAVEEESSGWRGYLASMSTVVNASDERIGVFPVRLCGTVDGDLDQLMGRLQALDPKSTEDRAVLCRELSQAVAQLIGDPFGNRLTVFISHTKRHSLAEEPDDVDNLIARIRDTIANTRLRAYFDTADLQLGSDWDQELRSNAASSALLAVRTDLYASREWCQREFLIAKRSGMPIVTLSAIRRAEERGSFIMDHVPSVGYRQPEAEAATSVIKVALNMLVDGALSRALWLVQEDMMQGMGIDWAPPQAPEPVTLLPWLLDNRYRFAKDGPIVIMHPDPPLGPEESSVIAELLALAGVADVIDIVTPRTLASRVTQDILWPPN